jgi:hypothetical protein
MSKKKWLIGIAAAVAFGVMALALVTLVLVLGLFAGGETAAAGIGLPAYQSTQIASVHPGYRRTTLTGGGQTYVNDYEEYGLQLINSDPSPVVGRYGFGNGKICGIQGQPTTAYIAGDVGSEMPAYAVFRNTTQPPFDWRTVKFRELQITLPNAARTVLRSSDPEMLKAVLRTLREGAPSTPPTAVSTSLTTLSTVLLYSDELPGMAYCPSIFFDPRGSIYLSENISVQPSKGSTSVSARWVVADQKLQEWLSGR